jgi:hypothetical protein
MDERLDALFALTGESFTSVEGTITMHGVAPLTVFFADREAGHVPTESFVQLFNGGFEPKAVLSFLEEAPDAVVIVREPHVDGGSLEATVELVDGVLPAEAGACVLFVDALDQPLEPVLAPPARRRKR